MELEFLETVSAHVGIIHKVCRLYGKNDDDRKDLYQEIVLQLWRSFPTYRGTAQASTWMYRVALNTAISLYRKEARQPQAVSYEEQWLEIDQVVFSSENDDQMQQLYAAVDQLSPVEKAIVLLYLDDKSYEEIAGITGISVVNVGVKLNRIKARLKRIVDVTNQ